MILTQLRDHVPVNLRKRRIVKMTIKSRENRETFQNVIRGPFSRISIDRMRANPFPPVKIEGRKACEAGMSDDGANRLFRSFCVLYGSCPR
jgi:hypothetical protein